MYLYGKNSVLERLKVNPGSIRTIFLQDNFKDRALLEAIGSIDIPVKVVNERELNRIKHADRIQGVLARVNEYEYTPFNDLLHDPQAVVGVPEQSGCRRRPTFLFLDSINDPHNLGSILRITACFGGFAVVIPKHGSCGVNDTVVHVASGGENYTPVSMVTNMTVALLKAKKEGYWVVGTVVEEGSDINDVALPFPVCLVLGSEGKGIRYGIRKHLDMTVSLPMRGAALSFNVAMACAIFCHEISRRRAAEEKR